MDLVFIILILLIFVINNSTGGSVYTYDNIKPDNEERIRKRNPEMTDQEIEYCLEYEADYWNVSINTLRI